jgi:site-specific recombinase XerD
MLRGGASLGEVGQVLRHQHVATTSIYAKVDLGSLAMLARPWPQVSA